MIAKKRVKLTLNLKEETKPHHILADFLSPTKNGLVWGGSRQATIKSDLVGGKLSMFDFQTSRGILSASVWWSPTMYREEISDSVVIFS